MRNELPAKLEVAELGALVVEERRIEVEPAMRTEARIWPRRACCNGTLTTNVGAASDVADGCVADECVSSDVAGSTAQAATERHEAQSSGVTAVQRKARAPVLRDE